MGPVKPNNISPNKPLFQLVMPTFLTTLGAPGEGARPI
jgi:hypothetical protein